MVLPVIFAKRVMTLALVVLVVFIVIQGAILVTVVNFVTQGAMGVLPVIRGLGVVV